MFVNQTRFEIKQFIPYKFCWDLEFFYSYNLFNLNDNLLKHFWIQCDRIRNINVCSVQGCAQVSLADFTLDTTWLRWYNILSFRFMQSTTETSSTAPTPPKALLPPREESSDESTIISSQTSTLTRNQGNITCGIRTFT